MAPGSVEAVSAQPGPFPRRSRVFLLGAIARIFHYDIAPVVAAALLELAALEAIAGTALGVAVNRISHPRFRIEVFVVCGYVGILAHLLFQLGVNVTGIFATSAVATAVVGLALQDMLSNIAGGLALEFEREIRVGDFIRCSEHAGWVEHVRLRHTAIKTADGERVILPNSFLMRQPVAIVSRARRSFVPFSMPYAGDPTHLIEEVTKALRASPIMGVATEPAPACVVKEMAPGHVVLCGSEREPGAEHDQSGHVGRAGQEKQNRRALGDRTNAHPDSRQEPSAGGDPSGAPDGDHRAESLLGGGHLQAKAPRDLSEDRLEGQHVPQARGELE